MKKYYKIIGIIVISAIMVFVINFLGGEVIGRQTYDVKITAHRGDVTERPENTISAFKSAIEKGAQYVELDVRTTSDGVLIICHDSGLYKISGIRVDVDDVTYNQIKDLDVGSWYSDEFENERIPTFEEAIQVLAGKTKIDIEIKKSKNDKKLVGDIVDCLNKYNIKSSCIVTSMEYEYIKEVKKIDSEIETGFVTKRLKKSPEEYSYADAFCIKYTNISASLVKDIHECGKEVHAWTVNDASDIKRMIRCGVDNIVTDNIEYTGEIYLQELK